MQAMLAFYPNTYAYQRWLLVYTTLSNAVCPTLWPHMQTEPTSMTHIPKPSAIYRAKPTALVARTLTTAPIPVTTHPPAPHDTKKDDNAKTASSAQPVTSHLPHLTLPALLNHPAAHFLTHHALDAPLSTPSAPHAERLDTPSKHATYWQWQSASAATSATRCPLT